MTDRLVIDTCVLIEALRPGGSQTLRWIMANASRSLVPVIVDLEFFVGCKEAQKQKRYEELRKYLDTVRTSAEIVRQAIAMVRRANRGPGALDALVGAIAKAADAKVATFNTSHFKILGISTEHPPKG
jgi:predicted nucleic acid-binding protein